MEILYIVAATLITGGVCAYSITKSKKKQTEKPFNDALLKYGPTPMITGVKISFLYGVRNTTPCILIAEPTGVHVAYENSPQQDVVIPYKIITDVKTEGLDNYEKITIKYADEELILETVAEKQSIYFNNAAAAFGDFSAAVIAKSGVSR